MKTSLTQKLMLLALALGLGVLVACTGAEGPMGKDGTNGKDASQDCEKCHNAANTDFYTKWYQYKQSVHGTGELWQGEGGRGTTCAVCHNGDGFVQAVSNDALDATTAGVTPITCRTCHFIHTKYDSTDFKLRLSTAFQCRIDTTKPRFDFKGNSNTCGKCHQLRTYARLTSTVGTNPGFDSIFVSATAAITTNNGYTARGPHYGIATNMMTGVGLKSWKANANAGSGFDPASITTPNPHAALNDACVACHMSQDTTNVFNGGHKFFNPATGIAKMPAKDWKDDGCMDACHAKKDLGTLAIYKQMQTDLPAMAKLLVQKGLLNEIQDTNKYTGVISLLPVSMQVPKKGVNWLGSDTVSAIHNFVTMYKDRSLGAHNPALMKGMMDALKNFFK
ncbi:MAG: hypothetical protein NT007_18335 [Candidatus Kapabacteria bacterium]|nr:hypothetical protein [Candidatus Kapabacteria bacterium]